MRSRWVLAVVPLVSCSTTLNLPSPDAGGAADGSIGDGQAAEGSVTSEAGLLDAGLGDTGVPSGCLGNGQFCDDFERPPFSFPQRWVQTGIGIPNIPNSVMVAAGGSGNATKVLSFVADDKSTGVSARPDREFAGTAATERVTITFGMYLESVDRAVLVSIVDTMSTAAVDLAVDGINSLGIVGIPSSFRGVPSTGSWHTYGLSVSNSGITLTIDGAPSVPYVLPKPLGLQVHVEIGLMRKTLAAATTSQRVQFDDVVIE